MEMKKLNRCIVFLTGACAVLIFKKYRRKDDMTGEKYFVYYNLLNKWMKQKARGISIAERLQQRGIREVAVYGMGDIGRHLIYELSNTDVTVKYAIDRSVRSVIDIDTYSLDSEFPQVDAVIVTPILDYESIRCNLEQKLSCPVLSIEDLVNTMT